MIVLVPIVLVPSIFAHPSFFVLLICNEASRYSGLRIFWIMYKRLERKVCEQAEPQIELASIGPEAPRAGLRTSMERLSLAPAVFYAVLLPSLPHILCSSDT